MFRNSSKNGTNNDLGDIEFRQPLLTGSEGQGNSQTLFDADDSDEDDGVLGDLNTPYTSRTNRELGNDQEERPGRKVAPALRSTIASREIGVYVVLSSNLCIWSRHDL